MFFIKRNFNFNLVKNLAGPCLFQMIHKWFLRLILVIFSFLIIGITPSILCLIGLADGTIRLDNTMYFLKSIEDCSAYHQFTNNESSPRGRFMFIWVLDNIQYGCFLLFT